MGTRPGRNHYPTVLTVSHSPKPFLLHPHKHPSSSSPRLMRCVLCADHGCMTCVGGSTLKLSSPGSFQSLLAAVKTLLGGHRLSPKSRYTNTSCFPSCLNCSFLFRANVCWMSAAVHLDPCVQVQHWLYQLALELEERLTKDKDMVRTSPTDLFFG